MTQKSIDKQKNNLKEGANKKALSFAIKLFVLILVLGLLTTGFFELNRRMKDKIYPKVKIAGFNMGGKTQGEAIKIVSDYMQTLNSQGPELIFEDKIYKNRLDQMGVTFETETSIKLAYEYGREGDLKQRANDIYNLALYGKEFDILPTVDEKQLNDYLGKIAEVISAGAANATLKYENNQIVLYSAKSGRGLDKGKLKTDLIDFINKKTNSKINLVTSELSPTLTEEGTLDAKAQAEKYLNSAPIVLKYKKDDYTIGKDKIGSWLEFNENGNKLVTEISQDKLGSYAGWINNQYKIEKVDKEVLDGTSKILKQGQDGLEVDTAALKKDILARIYSGTPGDAIDIVTKDVPMGEVVIYPEAMPGRFSSKYIDIDISEQTLIAFEGNKEVNRFLISSGTWSHPTPTGQFYVYDKSRVTRMRGDGYDLPGVEWVSWWSGDYSIHGTYWHNNFGHRMSHGCVNASNANAEWIYNWDDIGTPVYVHD